MWQKFQSPSRNVSTAETLQPVIPLIPEALPIKEQDKAKFISLVLKNRAGGPNTSTYKKYVRKFEEGSVQEWIDLLKDFDEIWTQNVIHGGSDRAATVRALTHGETLSSFESALMEASEQNKLGELEPITPEHVQTTLNAISNQVFPHCALETQRIWMYRVMKKPKDLSVRKFSSALSRLNNALPLFPGVKEESKFSEKEIIQIMEWAIPAEWRSKFDLDSYTPADHPKAKFIEECEALERHEKEYKSVENKNSKSQKKEKFKKGGKFNGKKEKKKFHCTVHGWNNTHDSKKCFTLLNQNKKDGEKPNSEKKQ